MFKTSIPRFLRQGLTAPSANHVYPARGVHNLATASPFLEDRLARLRSPANVLDGDAFAPKQRHERVGVRGGYRGLKIRARDADPIAHSLEVAPVVTLASCLVEVVRLVLVHHGVQLHREHGASRSVLVALVEGYGVAHSGAVRVEPVAGGLVAAGAAKAEDRC